MSSKTDSSRHSELRVGSLSFSYGDRRILKNISFTLPAGQVCAMIGQNGSGKTTLLRCIASLLPHDGYCELSGLGTIEKMDQKQRAKVIGYHASHSVTPPDITCLELVETGFYPELGLLGRRSETQHREALDLLSQLEMNESADCPVSKLSGGQRQLALLARALVRRPPLLLLDEPDDALDFSVRRKVMDLILRQAEQTGCIALIASHDVNLMLRHAHRLLLLKDGVLEGDVNCTEQDPRKILPGFRELYGSVTLLRQGDCWLMAEEESE